MEQGEKHFGWESANRERNEALLTLAFGLVDGSKDAVKNGLRKLSQVRKSKSLKKQGFQEHHIIPQKLKEHELWEKAGIDPESRLNKIFLPNAERAKTYDKRSIHQGRHYKKIEDHFVTRMRTIHEEGKLNGWSQQQYRERLEKLIHEEYELLYSARRALNKHKRDWADQ